MGQQIELLQWALRENWQVWRGIKPVYARPNRRKKLFTEYRRGCQRHPKSVGVIPSCEFTEPFLS
jgi:hypothetical protein